jgi:hypothetical protein
MDYNCEVLNVKIFFLAGCAPMKSAVDLLLWFKMATRSGLNSGFKQWILSVDFITIKSKERNA